MSNDKVSSTFLRVRGYHLDGYKHVNNARYLEFMEEGRWGFFDDNPRFIELMEKEGVAFVVVNINISYQNPALLGDDLQILTSINEIGGKSALCQHEIIKKEDGRLIAKADVTFVLLDVNANKVINIEGGVREVLSCMIVNGSE